MVAKLANADGFIRGFPEVIILYYMFLFTLYYHTSSVSAQNPQSGNLCSPSSSPPTPSPLPPPLPSSPSLSSSLPTPSPPPPPPPPPSLLPSSSPLPSPPPPRPPSLSSSPPPTPHPPPPPSLSLSSTSPPTPSYLPLSHPLSPSPHQFIFSTCYDINTPFSFIPGVQHCSGRTGCNSIRRTETKV